MIEELGFIHVALCYELTATFRGYGLWPTLPLEYFFASCYSSFLQGISLSIRSRNCSRRVFRFFPWYCVSAKVN